ncbi:MAG: FG-GAP-like repeat-containing protein [Reichenbachiella sp.]|uniref:FG-GAP-like repeat-containing protein n=1 Tax=Reichenbachiella sp. TaxID=2184521 RepID=UPI0032638EC1
MIFDFRRNKKIYTSLFILVLIAGIFWSGSRYPQLNEKALMGGEAPTSGLSFDMPFSIEGTDSNLVRILYNTLNWIDTNKKGMAFGILFASALMLIFSLIDQSKVKSRMGNSILGLLIGAPLGVCTNCAAPIAKGLFDAGGRRETALATMTSSPTLNLVVLGMLFSLFPLYMVVIKIVFSLVFIIFGIPLLTYFIKPNESAELDCPIEKPAAFNNNLFEEHQVLDSHESWLSAGLWSLRNFVKSLWHIVKTTVPLMLLAGFLGSVFITIIPWDKFYTLFPIGGVITTLSIMVILAIIGTFLPVPIAFDVIIVAVLLNGGFPITYAMVLLFTLGIYSVYSFFITRQTMGLKLALGAYSMIAILGICAGVVSHKLKIQNDKELMLAFQNFRVGDSRPFQMTFQASVETKNNNETKAVVSNYSAAEQTPLGGDLSIIQHPFIKKDQLSSETLFQTIEGREMGFENTYHIQSRKLLEPFVHGNAISSGDFNKDGWQDVAFTSDMKVALYSNMQGSHFKNEYLNIFEDFNVYEVALIDLNNDTWLDLVVTTYNEGNYVAYNEQGTYSSQRIKKLPQPEGMVLTTAIAFADVDRDGDLDIYLGNWSSGWFTKFVLPTKNTTHLYSKNYLLINEEGEFKGQFLSHSIEGETLSSLMTDIDNDGHVDIVSGNDFEVSDQYFLGNGKGQFKPVKKNEKIVPETTFSTMNVSLSDVNNDLIPEIFLSASFSRDNYLTQTKEEICSCMTDDEERDFCMEYIQIQQLLHNVRFKGDFRECPDSLLADCIAYKLVFEDGKASENETLHEERCDFIPDLWDDHNLICNISAKDYLSVPTEENWNLQIDQVKGSVLLTHQQNGEFINQVEDYGLKDVGWSWNAKFMDMDNDGWQDLFVANGFLWKKSQESNFFFKNIEGSHFENITERAGVTNYLPSHAYTYLDFDNDGDQDILMIPAFGPLFLYENRNPSGQSIQFKVEDEIGNYSGIGSRITIHYGPNGEEHQMREIMASGGFKSFDTQEVHFGLGDYKKIQRIEIHWSTGEKDKFDIELNAGFKYTIKRSNQKGIVSNIAYGT